MLDAFDIFTHLEKLRQATRSIHCDHDDGYLKIINILNKDNTIFFIGNGGSSAIASHMAIDYTKNGGYKAMAFNDAAALTCLSNDISYEDVFSYQINKWAKENDIVFCISSSGESPNIINAAKVAIERGCFLVTLSSFNRDNRLSNMGAINFYVPTLEYGFAEITHLTILHTILDLAIGERN